MSHKLELKRYKNQKLMNDLNDMIIRIKMYLHMPDERIVSNNFIKPTNEELNDITNKLMKVLQKDNEPLVKEKKYLRFD